MRQVRVTPIAQLSPETHELLKPSFQDCILRMHLRHCAVFVCRLLLTSYLFEVISNSSCVSVVLGTVEPESIDQPNTVGMVADDGFPPTNPCDLNFMNRKRVILVSHELSLSGAPLLLMELGRVLRRNGASVFWITGNLKEKSSAVLSLERKLINLELKIMPARGMKTTAALRMADLVILNTAVAGKWIDAVLSAEAQNVFTKTLWWIHEMRGQYFAMDLVKHLPEVAGIIIDSQATAEYWRSRTIKRLRTTLPKMYVVHLGNSQQLMLAAEDAVARTYMRQRVRHTVGIHAHDVVFAMINSVSRGKGQDLFLRAFAEGLNLIKQSNIVQEKTPFTVHALLVGCDRAAPLYESMLRSLVKDNGLESIVHFVNKSVDVVAYLAASDVLVQNSQGRGECFGRITIEAMAFQMPILGTAAGGTLEIVVHESTGRLHPVGKEGVHSLAENIRDLTLDKSLRIRMGSRGYDRVKKHFMEHHMCERLSRVLQTVLSKLV